mmetsp:Transcript_11215/g.22968  ORF Transcript_11215/g.22968 Transcript_11215/m.22968 type:complete len:293 (-) Transcript_11215:80-958(-)
MGSVNESISSKPRAFVSFCSDRTMLAARLIESSANTAAEIEGRGATFTHFISPMGFMKGGVHFMVASSPSSLPSAAAKIARQLFIKEETEPDRRWTSTTTGSPFSPPAYNRMRKLTRSFVLHLAFTGFVTNLVSIEWERRASEIRLATSVASTPLIVRWVRSKGKSTGTRSRSPPFTSQAQGAVTPVQVCFTFKESDLVRPRDSGFDKPRGEGFEILPRPLGGNCRAGVRIIMDTDLISGFSASELVLEGANGSNIFDAPTDCLDPSLLLLMVTYNIRRRCCRLGCWFLSRI